MKKTEGRLVFSFVTAFDVKQPEVLAQPLKCADFVVGESSATLIIEVTEAVCAPVAEQKTAISSLAGQLKSGHLTKDLLMKLYGTHAHLAEEKFIPAKRVMFCVIIGLPASHATAPQRSIMRDKMTRITDRIGPSFHGTKRPVILVETIETWNARFVDSQISESSPAQ